MSQVTSFQSLFSSMPLCQGAQEDVYLTTNEAGQETTLRKAAKYPVTIGKVLLFVSGFCGLNLAAARGRDSESHSKIKYLLCVDKSDQTELFWKMISSVVPTSTREEAISKIRAINLGNPTALYPCTCWGGKKAKIEDVDLKEEISNQISWLSTDASYACIQKIFQKKHFAFIKGDMFNPGTTRSLAQVLQDHGLVLDTIYLSNLREYAEIQGCLPQFRSAMHELQRACFDQTYVVDTKPRVVCRPRSTPLTQWMRSGFYRADMQQAFVESLMYSPAVSSPSPTINIRILVVNGSGNPSLDQKAKKATQP